MNLPPLILSETKRGQAIKAWCQEGRSRWRALHHGGMPASDVARGLSDLMERAVVTLFETVCTRMPANSPKVALVALGGLGRRELAPFSDLDVTVLSETPDDDAVRSVADQIFYPLWDARLEVGHAVRSPDDFAALAQSDDTVRTAAVDCRPLAGDQELQQRLSQRLRQVVSSGTARRYATKAVRAWTEGGNAGTVYHLQPDIKTGPGGLRELHRVWWLARMLWKIESWHDLLSLGLVDRHGLDTLANGRAALLNLRLSMHFVAGRRQDQLRFELQDDVAAYLAVPSGPGDRGAADNLLETFYRHAKAVRAVSTRILERCSENLLPRGSGGVVRNIEGFDLFRGTLTLRRVEQFETAPLDLLRIFRVAQRQGVRLYVHARSRIAEAAPRLIDESFRGDSKAAREFVDILSDPRDGGDSLELLHELGVLERFVPEFAPVTGLAQRDLYHVHTVDAHLVACARCAIRLLQGTETAAPADVVQIAARVARPHVLVLSCLMHDIGKGHGHGHSERGAVMARAICLRLFLSDEDITDVEFLVLEHLSMFKISQRRDLEDEQLIARFASDVGHVERLDLLYLLSYADAVTTGPDAWTQWKGQLLRDLYLRSRRALREGGGNDNLVLQRALRLQQVVALNPAAGDLFQRLATRLLPRHLVSHRPTLLLRHLDAVQQALKTGACCTIGRDDRRDGYELVMVGPDRPGLLADLSGILAAWGVSVDAAHISGTADGLAIDTFVVRGGAARLFEFNERVAEMQREIEQGMLGSLHFRHRILERRRAQEATSSGIPRPETRVIYDHESQPDATVVDVFAPDRVGFLHDVTRAIFRAGASITLARVTTEGERAVDAFYLVNSASRLPLSEPEQVAIEGAIRAAAAGHLKWDEGQ